MSRQPDNGGRSELTTFCLDVVCALIVQRGRLLIVQYGPHSKHPGKWEFPGGKVHPGETPEAAVQREIFEELGLRVIPAGALKPVVEHSTGRQIRLIPVICDVITGDMVLKDHESYLWVSLEELMRLDLLPADRLLATDSINREKLVSLLTRGEK